MSEERLSPELSAIEAALASLAPGPSRVDRDRVMFLAGQAAARTAGKTRGRIGGWLWPAATAASLLLAATLGAALALRPAQQIASVPQEPVPATVDGQQRVGVEYLTLRRLVLERGVDALPEPAGEIGRAKPASAAGPASRDMLRQLIDG